MLSGYLSPDGTFYNAPSYSHMSVAQQIAEHNSGVKMDGGADNEM